MAGIFNVDIFNDDIFNTTAVVAVQGVDIQGTHAIADLRGLGTDKPRKKKQRLQCININGKIRCYIEVPIFSKIVKTTGAKLSSAVGLLFATAFKGKISRFSESLEIEPLRYSFTSKLNFLVPFSNTTKNRLKKEKLKKLWEEYKSIEDL